MVLNPTWNASIEARHSHFFYRFVGELPKHIFGGFGFVEINDESCLGLFFLRL
jgi:hypothetical protein